MSTLTITHSPAEGTLIDGTTRGDGSAEVLKTHGWRWSRNLGSWYVQRSRDAAPKMHVINRTAEALRAAGFTVETEIDASYRTAAEVEADKIARQQDRVDALEDKAARKGSAAEAAWAADQAAHDSLPDGGEPIKVGHHSEHRHRRAVEKSWSTLGKAVQAEHAAASARGRADAAASTTSSRYAPNAVARRIEKLRTELRGWERSRDGSTRTLFVHPVTGEKHTETHDAATGSHRERVLVEIDRVADEIAYWEGVRAHQVESGTAAVYAREVIVKGDRISYRRGEWHEVVRVNAKSVTIPSIVGGSWTDRVPYTDVRGLRDADGNTVRIVNGERALDTAAA